MLLLFTFLTPIRLRALFPFPDPLTADQSKQFSEIVPFYAQILESFNNAPNDDFSPVTDNPSDLLQRYLAVAKRNSEVLYPRSTSAIPTVDIGVGKDCFVPNYFVVLTTLQV